MDNRTGEIMFPQAFRKLIEENPESEELFTEMVIEPTEKQLARKPPKVGRNEPCPCGSGKKFKKCHWLKEK